MYANVIHYTMKRNPKIVQSMDPGLAAGETFRISNMFVW